MTPPLESTITWTEFAAPVTAPWRSEAGWPPPRRVEVADERLAAPAAFKLICEGTALLWRGDFHRGKDLLQALAGRIDGPPRGGRAAAAGPAGPAPASMTDRFHRERQARGRRARLLGMLLVPMDPGHQVPLRRAPDVQAACDEAWGPSGAPCVVALRELLGVIGAHEWRKAGVVIPALGNGRIHAHYGVFSPVRGEYLDLLGRAPLPRSLQTMPLAFDIGTGTGVLAALLARRGGPRVIPTDHTDRALACARDNIGRLGLGATVDVVRADLFPDPDVGPAALAVCNPPWVPARPGSALEAAVYDPDSAMLRGFLAGLAARLAPGGEGWLILSDLAEHLGLRSRDELLGWIAAGGLQVIARLDTRPVHGRARDTADPLHQARAAEVTSLWRLAAQ